MRKTVDYNLYFNAPPEKEAEVSPFASGLYEWVDSIVIALAALTLVFAFVFRIAGVVGPSMFPTLHDGDWITISSFGEAPERGDIIISAQPNYPKPIVKRVIGVSGDKINIDFVNNTVAVNGKIIDEPYINAPTQLSYDVEFPVTVPEGCVFVMGDNRNESLDSRSTDIGFIDERYILGKAWFRLVPLGGIK